MESSPTHYLLQEFCDPESPYYSTHISWWIGQLREWKHQSRTAEAGKFDYAIYHGCMGVFQASKHLLGGDLDAAIGDAVIQELVRALPLTTEKSAARQNIEALIESIRSDVEYMRRK